MGSCMFRLDILLSKPRSSIRLLVGCPDVAAALAVSGGAVLASREFRSIKLSECVLLADGARDLLLVFGFA